MVSFPLVVADMKQCVQDSWHECVESEGWCTWHSIVIHQLYDRAVRSASTDIR